MVFLYFQNNASAINQFIGMQRSSSECGKSQDNELVTGAVFFLLPLSCSLCKMPHSPHLAHKVPVMQAIVGVASRSIQLNLSQSWDMHISLRYVPRLLLLTPTMLFLLERMWQSQSWVSRNRSILILLTSIPFSLCYSCTCMALLTSKNFVCLFTIMFALFTLTTLLMTDSIATENQP